MPIYKFYCVGCREEEERILLMSERDSPQECTCGAKLQRIMTLPAPARIVVTGREKALKTLNKEDGYDLPARPHDRPRMEKAMARGLGLAY
jgi:putative FmdB family regulatory protein